MQMHTKVVLNFRRIRFWRKTWFLAWIWNRVHCNNYFGIGSGCELL